MRSVLVVTLTMCMAGWAVAQAPLFTDWGGAEAVGGKAPAVANPTCPDRTVFSQQTDVADPSWNALVSEETSYVAFDNFWGVSDEICAVRWWGVFMGCEESAELYTITFYTDAGGAPGGVVDSFTVVPVKTDTGLLDPIYGTNPIYEYDATLPYCVSLTSGWISITSYGDPGCWFYWVVSPDGDGMCYQSGVGHRAYDLAMCLVTSPSCPGGSLSSQAPNFFFPLPSDMDPDVGGEYLAFENFPAGGGSLSEPICDLHWWGTYLSLGGPCSESQDTFEINFYEDDGGQPGDEVYSYRVTADRQDTGFMTFLSGTPVYEFGADLPSCCPLTSGWVSIQGYGGNTSCWHAWVMSLDGDFGCYFWDGSAMNPFSPDLSLCLTTKPDGDGDLVPDDLDDCPGTAAGDPVDSDGCSTADDDGDGVLNDQDNCPGTPTCADVDSDGCTSDSDDDGVADGCDDCPGTAAGDPVDSDGCSTADDDGDGVRNDQDICANTPTCATNVKANGCPIDSDGDGNVDGCEPPPRICCGATGPVAPLGLAVGLLLLSRFAGWRSARRR